MTDTKNVEHQKSLNNLPRNEKSFNICQKDFRLKKTGPKEIVKTEVYNS